MPDLVLAAELRVLVAEGVEGVRVGRHDPPEAGLRELPDVVLDEHLEQALLARPPDVVAGVALALVEDPEVDAGRLEDAGHEAGRVLDPDVERGEVADEPQPVDVLPARVADRRRRGRPSTWPARPAGLAERVALLGEAGEGRLEPGLDDRPGRRASGASRRWSGRARSRRDRPRRRRGRSCTTRASRPGSGRRRPGRRR